MGILAGVLAAAGFVAVVVYASHRQARERTTELAAAATRLGWAFRADVAYDSIPDLERFELFAQGRSRKLSNLLTSPAGEVRGVVFDYTYVTGGGKSQQTHRQSVFYGASDALSLPKFSLRPQTFLHAIGKAFGYQDIDLAHRPTFSEMYLVRGEDEDAIRAALRDEAVEFLEKRAGVCAAGIGRELLYWRAGRRVKPDELDAFIAEGCELVARFSGRRGDAAVS